MKPNQRSSYANRIDRAITLMQQRLANGDAPTIDQLAAAAALSKYHFHRVFRAMTGETIGAAITRARLGGSLPMLDNSIMAATERAGYSTSQAYARALKEQTNVTPSQLKNDVHQRSEVAAELSRPSIERSETMPALEITIESLMPLRLAVLRNVGDYKELNHGFNRLFECLMEHMSPENVSGLYGIPYDDPREVEAQDCRFDCAVTTLKDAPIGNGVEQILIAGGLALRMSHVGDYDEIHPAIDDMYREAILAELPIADEPLLVHYLDDPEEVAVDRLRSYVYLALTSVTSA
jgi:AraC family transcriptional regulator